VTRKRASKLYSLEFFPPKTEEGILKLRAARREFAALESKLNLLGQKYSGAREDNTNLKRSLDDKIASVASQFDVA